MLADVGHYNGQHLFYSLCSHIGVISIVISLTIPQSTIYCLNLLKWVAIKCPRAWPLAMFESWPLFKGHYIGKSIGQLMLWLLLTNGHYSQGLYREGQLYHMIWVEITTLQIASHSIMP